MAQTQSPDSGTHVLFPLLSEVQSPFRETAGGKAGTLARLIQAGYPVPNGFVVPPEAFTDGEIPANLARTLTTALERLTANRMQSARFAVRSSAAAEDSDRASFAGEFESVLDVPADKVAEAASRVWRSQYGDRVRTYAEAQGLARSHRMNVLVQRMVPAEISGVLFTADPITGSRKAMVGNAIPGLGDRLVSGEADPTVFRLHRPSGRLEIEGGGALDGFAKPIDELFRLAARLERELSAPQDIEWAISGGRIQILQTRAITTLNPIDRTTGARNDSRLGDYLWTSTNFGEALPDVMTPLTSSMMMLYLKVNSLGVETDTFPMGGNIGGRFYMNLSLPASLFSALGFGKSRLEAALAEAFGELPEGVEIPIVPNTRVKAIREFLPHAVRRARLVGGLKKEIPAFVASASEKAAELEEAIAACETPASLRSVWAARLGPLVRHAMLMLAAGTSDYKNLSRSLRPKLAALIGEADANALLSGRPGTTELASLGPLLGLSRLAEGEITVAEYRTACGHRGPSEFELSLPTPMETEGWIEEQVAAVRAADRGVDDLLAGKKQGYEAAWARFRRDHPRSIRRWDRRLAAIHAASRTREAVRSEVVRLLRLLRPYALRAADLCGIGGDVFYLSIDEIDRLLDGDRSVLEAVPDRRELHDRLAALPPYPQFIRGRFDPFSWAADPDRPVHVFQPDGAGIKVERRSESDSIRGFSGSPGVVEGRVRVLASVDESREFEPGEILVAHTTNVGWTPLFPRAAAIITDVGAPLSHAAIVARELGIPAVVGAGTATRRLSTGDRVRVDGARGLVTIL